MTDDVTNVARNLPRRTVAWSISAGRADSIAKLTAHAARTARAYALDGVSALGISVFAALDDIGAASLDGILSRVGTGDELTTPSPPHDERTSRRCRSAIPSSWFLSTGPRAIRASAPLRAASNSTAR